MYATHTLRLLRRAALLLTVFLLVMSAVQASDSLEEGPDTLMYDSQGKPYILIQGDIMVPPDWYETVADKTPWSNNFWSGGVVPYVFSSNVDATNQTRMLNAMAIWERVADVDFVPRSGQSNYIYIINDPTTNSSYVGPQGGSQDVRIASWTSQIVIAHELDHALGFWHEQSRPDRDAYVQINWDYIDPDKRHNFDKETTAGYWGYYDFMSIMHYGQFAFNEDTCGVGGSQPCTTITVLAPYQMYQGLIGNRDSLTHVDSLTTAFIYTQNSLWCFMSNRAGGTQTGSFRHPWGSLTTATVNMTSGSTLWVTERGDYAVSGTYTRPMTIRPALGQVTLTNGSNGVLLQAESAGIEVLSGGGIDFQSPVSD